MVWIAIFRLWSTNWTRRNIHYGNFFDVQQIVVSRPKGQKITLGVMLIDWDSQQGRERATSGRYKKIWLGQSYIMRKVWYHQIWIQNCLGFIVLWCTTYLKFCTPLNHSTQVLCQHPFSNHKLWIEMKRTKVYSKVFLIMKSTVYKFFLPDIGGFDLVDLIITDLKDHMICYKLEWSHWWKIYL